MKFHKIILLFLFALILASCGKTVTSKDVAYYADEDIIVVKNTKNKPFSGTIEYYDEQGLFKYELKVRKGKYVNSDTTIKIDVRDLYSEQYSEYIRLEQLLNDTTRVFLKGNDNPLTGNIILTNTSKDELDEYYFDFSKALIPFRGGLLHGDFIVYDEDGNIDSKTSYINGIKDGEYIYYGYNGNIRRKAPYIKGKLHGEVLIYGEDGNIEKRENYKHGKNHGEIVFYYDNGDIKSIFNYADGKKHGDIIHYYENGKIRYISHSKNDISVGECITYYENGNEKTKIYYTNGVWDGPVIEYLENGEIKHSWYYKNGVRLY